MPWGSGEWNDINGRCCIRLGRLEIYKKAGLSREQHEELAEYCDSKNILFLTSVFNINDVEWLAKINTNTIKIPSHEVYNQALIEKVEAVDVPRMNFLMIDGKGDPNTSQEFKDAIGVLYPLSYTLKFMIKKGEIGWKRISYK